jgi:hypothetical protein
MQAITQDIEFRFARVIFGKLNVSRALSALTWLHESTFPVPLCYSVSCPLHTQYVPRSNNVRSPLNMIRVAFKGSEDFKYTQIDGRGFTSYLLDN